MAANQGTSNWAMAPGPEVVTLLCFVKKKPLPEGIVSI